jgi:hypothetical protein
MPHHAGAHSPAPVVTSLSIVVLSLLACRMERAPRPSSSAPAWGVSTLADTGFGPILVGMTPDEANAAAGGALKLPAGLGPEGCDYAFAPEVPGLALMIEDGRVVRIEVKTTGITTSEGARVGDSEDRIREGGHRVPRWPRSPSRLRGRLCVRGMPPNWRLELTGATTK